MANINRLKEKKDYIGRKNALYREKIARYEEKSARVEEKIAKVKNKQIKAIKKEMIQAGQSALDEETMKKYLENSL